MTKSTKPRPRLIEVVDQPDYVGVGAEYGVRRWSNERIAAAINAAWGVEVARVADREFRFSDGVHIALPVVVSDFVRGLHPLKGHRPPPFFAGPAPSMEHR